ncbi:restriction endonuclease subunit S [Ponticaulis koreensis]|uniref:restriction endonuclease subunit S n=1 Tax=Ponticaulis koreensis TaxID=1123045 RepID=UPI0003B65619|nr:restriction endonuclease subunit S [Ponticaulis koreensis]
MESGTVPTKQTMHVPELRFPEFSGDWDHKTIGESFPKVRNGFVGTATPFYKPNGIAYFQGRNIKSGLLDREDTVSISAEFHNKQTKSQVKPFDILMVQSGHVGECACVPEGIGEANCHAVVVMTPDKETHSPFFVNYFYSETGLRQIHKIKTGNTVEHILTSDLKPLVVATPKLSEQKKIASFLSAVDEKIAQLTRKKALLEDYKKGCMQQLFSQKIRFKDDDGNDFPDWEPLEFGKLVKRSSDRFDPIANSERPILIELENMDQATGMLIGHEDVSTQKSLKTYFKAGDVLFGKLRPYLRKYAQPNFDGVCSSEIWVLQSDAVHKGFLFQLVQTSQFMQLATISTGSKMPRADWNTIADSQFDWPHFDEQRKIADFLSSIDARISSAATEIQFAQTFKKGLLQQMFV